MALIRFFVTIMLVATTLNFGAAAEISPKYKVQEQQLWHWMTQCEVPVCLHEAVRLVHGVQHIAQRVQAWADDSHRTEEQYAQIKKDGLVLADRVDAWGAKYNIKPLDLPEQTSMNR